MLHTRIENTQRIKTLRYPIGMVTVVPAREISRRVGRHGVMQPASEPREGPQREELRRLVQLQTDHGLERGDGRGELDAPAAVAERWWFGPAPHLHPALLGIV